MTDGQRQTLVFVLAGYLAALAVMVLVPLGSVPSTLLSDLARLGGRLGAPAALVDPTRFEFIANIVVVIPAVAMASMLWPTVRWTSWTAYGFIASLTVEATQAVALVERSATYSDVVANTSGAMLGAILVWVIRRPLGRWGKLPPASASP